MAEPYARCEEGARRHFDGSNCRPAARIVQILPAVVESLPPCKIRYECRWLFVNALTFSPCYQELI
jgi:hypothetical protein